MESRGLEYARLYYGETREIFAYGGGPCPVLAHLLQETLLLVSTMLLGTPVDYLVQNVPSLSITSQEGHALLLYPAVTVLWQLVSYTVAAVKVGWPDFVATLVLVYIPPLTSKHRGCLVEAGLPPTELASLLELGTLLELLDPQ